MSVTSTVENKESGGEKTGKRRRAFWDRRWRRLDYVKFTASFTVHSLALMAPFYFTWSALWVTFLFYTIGGLGITLSYHRNLAHRSFKLPKWLEYLFAYFALLAIQGDPIDWVSTHRYHHQFTDSERDPHSPKEGFWFSHLLWIYDSAYLVQKCGRRANVEDLKRQWFYRFLQKTVMFHILGLGLILFYLGGMSFVTWGMGVGAALEVHVTCLINSLCHIWGSRSWKTNDTSRNVWRLMAKTPSSSEYGPIEEEFLAQIDSNTFGQITEFFKKYVEGKYGDEFVFLKSPLLSRPWRVIIVGDKLNDGWRRFAKFHGLRRGYYVHFTHEGNSVFYVTTFSEDGNRIIYGNKDSSLVISQTVSKREEKRKPVLCSEEAGKSVRTKGEAGVVIKDSGSCLISKKKSKNENTPQSVISDSFFQTVTQANVTRNSLYIPKKFATDNCLCAREMGFLGLLDIKHNVWVNEVTHCSDGRYKISVGWREFCRDNNLEVGDRCEFKLLPGSKEIMLELVGVYKDIQKLPAPDVNTICHVK